MLDFCVFDETCEVPSDVQDLLDQRQKAKDEKRYDDADSIREKIEIMGWNVVDEKEGSRVEKVQN